MKRHLRDMMVLGPLALLAASGAQAEEPQGLAVSAILGATTDYVYRGISLNSERPTPLAYFEAIAGSAYISGSVIGVDLGSDHFGQIGTIEADATAGFMPSFKLVTCNIGAKATMYPNGEDRVLGTREKAERDFIEPFVGATLQASDALSVGATLYWTPDFYNESGDVTTIEAQVSLSLPPWKAVSSKVTALAGYAHSEQTDIIAPGRAYTYWNAGIEARLERLIFDLRYWDTDVEGWDGYESRISVSAGVMLN